MKQKTVYFELEPEDEEPQKIVVRKLDPFLLITRVKAELEDGNIQLTQPPYFYPVSIPLVNNKCIILLLE